MNDFDKLGGLAPQDLRTRCYSDACWAGGHDGCGWGTCDCPCHHPDRPTAADWDALEAAFTEWAAVQGIPVPLYPKQAKVISGILGRTVTTFKTLTRPDVVSVLAGLEEATAAFADTAYQAAQQDTPTDTPTDIPGPEIVDAEVVE